MVTFSVSDVAITVKPVASFEYREIAIIGPMYGSRVDKLALTWNLHAFRTDAVAEFISYVSARIHPELINNSNEGWHFNADLYWREEICKGFKPMIPTIAITTPSNTVENKSEIV